jgi:CRP-like cAMP-binding protein
MLRRMATAPVELIKNVPLFSDLDDRELRQIAQSMKERTFNAGDVVTEEGKGGVGFFVIDDGNAKVSVGGQERGALGPGDYFGEIALLLSLIERTPRTATVVTETPVRCFVLSKGEFRSVIYERNIAANLLHNMAQMLDAASTRPTA